jgi:chromosome segregation ATPase
MLDAGETLTEIRSETGASLSALSRYNSFRKSHMARVVDAEADMYDLIQRLLDAADDARDARRHARRSGGSAAARARAIATEAALLGRLLENLGVDDSRVAEELETARGLVLAIRDHIDHDETSVSIIERVRNVPGLADVAVALSNRLRGANDDH